MALSWDEDLATQELRRQAADPGLGLESLTAATTLREFATGRLDTTWRPARR